MTRKIKRKYIDFIFLLTIVFVTLFGTLSFSNFALAQRICPSRTTAEGQTTVTFVGNLTYTGGEDTFVWFEYGRTTGYGQRTSEERLTREGISCATVSNLEPCTTYNYRAVARNSAGTYHGENRTITTACPTPPPVTANLTINKLVRNLSDGTGWLDSVHADPGEMISFSIRITVGGRETARNVLVQSTLSPQITYQGALRIDDAPRTGANIIAGINLGDIAPNQSRTITFNAQVASRDQFGYGQTNLINTTTASNPNTNINDSASVIVSKTAVAGAVTKIDTGFGGKIANYIFFPAFLAFLMILIFKNYFVIISEWLEKKKNEMLEYRSNRFLRNVVSKIRIKEKIS